MYKGAGDEREVRLRPSAASRPANASDAAETTRFAELSIWCICIIAHYSSARHADAARPSVYEWRRFECRADGHFAVRERLRCCVVAELCSGRTGSISATCEDGVSGQ